MERKLTNIFIYPVKSMGGFEAVTSIVEKRGLRDDRRYMVVDPNGRFISQRESPELSCIDVRTEKEGIVLRLKDGESIFVRQPDADVRPELPVMVWNSDVSAVVAESDANRWISNVLARDVRLVFMPDSSKRPVSPRFDHGNDIVSFADGYPLLLVNTGSLGALNERLQDAIPIDRFRPNLVVEGEAFEEDRWDRIKVGECVFRIAKPCARCVVTTVDQQTGSKGKGEPLTTLSEFRKAKQVYPDSYEHFDLNPNDVLFGVNLIPESPERSVAASDKLEVLEAKL